VLVVDETGDLKKEVATVGVRAGTRHRRHRRPRPRPTCRRQVRRTS
jgi:hypothetical protein